MSFKVGLAHEYVWESKNKMLVWAYKETPEDTNKKF